MTELIHEAGKEIVTVGGRIAGLVSCLPNNKVSNDYFVGKFGEETVTEVTKMVGVHTRYWCDESITTKDLCLKAGEHLLEELAWNANSIDAIIFISQTPDYILPSTAFALHDGLNLSSNCLAFDVNLGCSAYPYALWLGMSMIQAGTAKRVLLAVGDTISKVVDPHDRSTAFLFGDAGTMTALESTVDEDSKSHFVLGSDGSGERHLIIPEGKFRKLSIQEKATFENKNTECLYMDGSEIFNFTLRRIPKLVSSLLRLSGQEAENVDAFLFHQANSFMLKHLAKKAKLPTDKVPLNIDRYGNTSSASIPLLMTTDIKTQLLNEKVNLAMFGFGVGFSWAAASIKAGPLKVAETIYL